MRCTTGFCPTTDPQQFLNAKSVSLRMDGEPLQLHTECESSVGINLPTAYAALVLHWLVSKLSLNGALILGQNGIARCCSLKVVRMAQSSKKEGFVSIGIG